MPRRFLAAGALVVALAACSSSPSTAPSTVAPGAVTPTTMAPTTVTPTTVPSTEPGTTAPTSASTSAPPTTPPATAAPSTTRPSGSGPGGAADYLAESGYTFTDAEAACLDEEAGPEANAALAAALKDGGEPNEAVGVALVKALSACEPQSYLDSQVAAVQSNSTVSDEDALCVVRVVNDLVVDEPVMASLAASGTSTGEWPAAEKERLRAVVLTCVSPDQADAIIES